MLKQNKTLPIFVLEKLNSVGIRNSKASEILADSVIQQKMISSFQNCKDSTVSWSFYGFLSFLLIRIPFMVC